MVSSADDIPFLTSLAREAHKESRWRGIPFSEAKVCKLAEAAISDQTRHGILLALKGSEPVGFCYCSVGEYFVGLDSLLTTVHVIWVAPAVRAGLGGGRVALGLMRGIETWSQARGTAEILLHVTSSVDLARSHKLAKRLRYEFVGGNYAKKIAKGAE